MGGGASKQLILGEFHNAIRSGDFKEMIKVHGDNPKLNLLNMQEKKVLVLHILCCTDLELYL